jgi:23S rRNA pseudouridine2605 synthase
VEVNGRVVSTLPAFADPTSDRITVDGRPLPKAQRPVYIMVNKPQRMLTVAADEPGVDRATVMDLVTHPAKPRLFPVGRLDWMTTGLVLLTNDGELANRLTHPRYGVEKTYRALVRGKFDQEATDQLRQRLVRAIRKDDRRAGVRRRAVGQVESTRQGPAGHSDTEIAIEGYDQGRTSLLITVREGRTGNIAKMLTAAGASVRKLERIAIGPLQLRGLPRAGWRELERREINALKAAAKGKGLAGPPRRREVNPQSRKPKRDRAGANRPATGKRQRKDQR